MIDVFEPLTKKDECFSEHVWEYCEDNYNEPIEQFEYIFNDINEQKWLSKKEKQTVIDNIICEYVTTESDA